MESLADEIAHHSSLKEVAQLQNRIHDLTRFEMPASYLAIIEKMNRQLKEISTGPENLERLLESLDAVQELRNTLAHLPSDQLRQVSQSAYSLENEDG